MRWHPKHARPRHWFMKDGRPSLARVAAAALSVAVAVGVTAALATRGGGAHPANQSLGVVVPVQSPGASASGALGDGAAGAAASSSPAADVRPVSVDIPTIGVHASLQMLGLDSSGALQPPTNLTQAGWYTGSAVPGTTGPAVIAGHVDSVSGPAVFFNLKSLNTGDRITVGLSSGRSVAFQVMLVRHYPKDAFPTQDVYGGRPDPELRLITCGGSFTDGHYLDNVVVFAALAK